MRSILGHKIVAIVGLSRDCSKESHHVAAYLKTHGYTIVPVNPFADEILGEKCYRSLAEMPPDVQRSIEIVDIFRPSEDVQRIVAQAIELKKMHGKLRAIWMQVGIVDEMAAEHARKEGLEVVMNRCMMLEHKRLFRVSKE
ncbi:MAG: CoA-binding protein [Candidatus Hadarchaeum sp.]